MEELSSVFVRAVIPVVALRWDDKEGILLKATATPTLLLPTGLGSQRSMKWNGSIPHVPENEPALDKMPRKLRSLEHRN
jgi:hypothetical protein